jgi:REP element-mobilizing transposase RayT
MEISSYSSSKGAISVGVNFNPMYRHAIFKYEPLKIFCERRIREAAEIYGKTYQFKLDEAGLDIDHAHVLVTFGPNVKLCDIIKKLKEYSARALFKTFPWLRGYDETNILGKGKKQKLFTKGRFWSGGYYFESYGRKTFESHKNYVANQGKQHMIERSQTKLNTFIAA